MAKKSAAGKILVIVESPTKARTIRKFLGKNYVVESCMGHVRDLPKSAKDIPEKVKKEPWAKLGVNPKKNFAPLYCIPKDKTKVVSNLKSLLKDADELILATDEDREGESISWHLLEILKPKIPVKRMVFHEITKEAIQDSLEHTRDIDFNLVRAQEARRILDRLVGYTISPLLWKKIAYGLSAGRVQSVGVKLICEREHERLKFVKASYCGVLGELSKSKEVFATKLISVKGKKIALGKDFDPDSGKLKTKDNLHLQKAEAKKILDNAKKSKWLVESVEEKPLSRSPYAPFITSTLQQDASRKFGWSSRNTMRVAQGLYEKGFITYMRTDSIFLSAQAIKAARSTIEELYGKKYLPEKPRTFKQKSKGAQEAHEAIRPAGTEFRHPKDAGLKGDEQKLYDLIWKRTVASQMQNSKQKQVQVRFKVEDYLFGSSGMFIEFPGFLKVYVEGTDDSSGDPREVKLPSMKKGEVVKLEKLDVTEHETKPPSRFTEAGIIQTMEREGIGRPSTYAAVISTVIDRGYVQKTGNTLKPTFTAMVVSNLLVNYFSDFVDLKFTSDMEESLDNIAEGELEYVSYLKKVYSGKSGLEKLIEKQEKIIDPETARTISLHGFEKYTFKVGRYGAYVCRDEAGEEVCASIPESHAPSEVTEELINKLIDQKINGVDALGTDPESGLPIYILNGRFGPYVQLGETNWDEKTKPKRVSIPPIIDPDNITFDEAKLLASLPKTLGQHAEDEKDIKMGIGRFGPYIVHDGDFRSIPKTDSIFTMTFEKALVLLAQPKKGRGRKSKALKELGKHPDDELPIAIFDGRYGPYIKWGKKNIAIPDEEEPTKLTLAKALEIIGEKKGKKKTKKAKKKTAKKAGKKASNGKSIKKATKIKKKTKKKLSKNAKAQKKSAKTSASSASVN